MILKEMKKLSALAMQVVWLQTDHGQERAWEDNEANEAASRGANDATPFDVDDIVDHLYGDVLSEAEEWTNARIRTYQARQCEGED